MLRGRIRDNFWFSLVGFARFQSKKINLLFLLSVRWTERTVQNYTLWQLYWSGLTGNFQASKPLSSGMLGLLKNVLTTVAFKVSFLPLSSFLAWSAFIAIISENEVMIFFLIWCAIFGVCLWILNDLNRDHQYWVRTSSLSILRIQVSVVGLRVLSTEGRTDSIFA